MVLVRVLPSRVRLAALLVLSTLVAACGDSPTAPSSYAPFSQTDLRVGTGTTAAIGNVLTVNYTGWLYNGEQPDQKGAQFDSSAGLTPFSFTLGAGQVIERLGPRPGGDAGRRDAAPRHSSIAGLRREPQHHHPALRDAGVRGRTAGGPMTRREPSWVGQACRDRVNTGSGPRRLALAAVLCVIAGSRVATAQTVVVKNAPPGATIEVLVNATAAGSTAADAEGNAKIALPAAANPDKQDFDAYIFVDVCGSRRRVLIAATGGNAAPQDAACARREIPGVFWVRPITTLVVDVGGASPTLLLRQGPYDPSASPRTWSPVPTGLVVSGGAGWSWLGNASAVACGNVSICTGDESGFGYTVGAAYWFTRNVAAEATWMKPGGMSAEGGGTDYRFTSEQDTSVLTVAGKVGGPVGPVRIYGTLGTTYQRSTLSTTQTIDDRTVIVGEVTTTIQGATQALAVRTSGWGWLAGGGADFWVSRHFAAYAEFTRASLKGSDRDGGEGVLDDSLTTIMFGARVRIGR